jgi:hypothetical protein
MHSQLGAFDARDPIGYSDNQAKSLYSYVDDDPLSWVDPYGLKKTLQQICQDKLDNCIAKAKKEYDLTIKAALQDFQQCIANWFDSPTCPDPSICKKVYQQNLSSALKTEDRDYKKCKSDYNSCVRSGGL